jgi:hypothetical protein
MNARTVCMYGGFEPTIMPHASISVELCIMTWQRPWPTGPVLSMSRACGSNVDMSNARPSAPSQLFKPPRLRTEYEVFIFATGQSALQSDQTFYLKHR